MTESEIARLSRREMTDLILNQQSYIGKLESLIRIREDELEEAKKAVPDNTIKIAECGSIAEASLKLFDLFSSAQSAADVYLESVRTRTADSEAEINRLEEKKRAEAEAMLTAASAEAAEIIADAQKRADEIMSAASEKAAVTLESAEKMLSAAETDSKEIREASVRYFLDRHREEQEKKQ